MIPFTLGTIYCKDDSQTKVLSTESIYFMEENSYKCLYILDSNYQEKKNGRGNKLICMHYGINYI